MSKICKLGHVTSLSQKPYFVKGEHFCYFLKLRCSFHDFKASRYIFPVLGKVKIVKKKLLKRHLLLLGDWVLVEETVNFQNQWNISQLPSIVPLLWSLGRALYQFSWNRLFAKCSHFGLKIFLGFLAVSSHVTQFVYVWQIKNNNFKRRICLPRVYVVMNKVSEGTPPLNIF